jgi:hypothetical protein
MILFRLSLESVAIGVFLPAGSLNYWQVRIFVSFYTDVLRGFIFFKERPPPESGE